MKVRLPGGLPLFGGDPDATLAAAGLEARPPVRLEDGLILTDWERAREGGRTAESCGSYGVYLSVFRHGRAWPGHPREH